MAGCGECDLCRELTGVVEHHGYHRATSQLAGPHWWGTRRALEWRLAVGGASQTEDWPQVRRGLSLADALATGADHAERLHRITLHVAAEFGYESEAHAVGLIGLAYAAAQRGDSAEAGSLLDRAAACRCCAVPDAMEDLAAFVVHQEAERLAAAGAVEDAAGTLGRLVAGPWGGAPAMRDRVVLTAARLRLLLGDEDNVLVGLLWHVAWRSGGWNDGAGTNDPVLFGLLETAARAAFALESAAAGQLSLLDPAAPAAGAERRAPFLADLRRRLVESAGRGPLQVGRLWHLGSQLPLPGFDSVMLVAPPEADGPLPTADGEKAEPPWSGWRRLLDEAVRRRAFAEAVCAHLAWRQRAAWGLAVGDGAVCWSPRPVLGFRQWTLEADGLRGAYGAWWTRPEARGACMVGPGVPHTDVRCGECGIYAYSSMGALRLPEGRETAVVGLVELSGRVVEHEHGYRAERAEVMAVAACLGDHVVISADRRWIAELFRRPAVALADAVAGRGEREAEVRRLRNADRRAEFVRGFLARCRREAAARYD
jgi:hypothetical protein